MDEDEGSVTFQVENRNPDREGEYTVQFTTADGSAVQTTDRGTEGMLKRNSLLLCYVTVIYS